MAPASTIVAVMAAAPWAYAAVSMVLLERLVMWFSAAWIATREAPAWTVNVPVTAPIMGQLANSTAAKRIAMVAATVTVASVFVVVDIGGRAVKIVCRFHIPPYPKLSRKRTYQCLIARKCKVSRLQVAPMTATTVAGAN